MLTRCLTLLIASGLLLPPAPATADSEKDRMGKLLRDKYPQQDTKPRSGARHPISTSLIPRDASVSSPPRPAPRTRTARTKAHWRPPRLGGWHQ